VRISIELKLTYGQAIQLLLLLAMLIAAAM
jgi:hypothetical protein